MCKGDEQQGSKGRSKVNELEYEDTEGRDISCDPDGNNFVIESVEIPKNNKIVSSVLSPQSSTLSQRENMLTHLPFAQTNCVGWQVRAAQISGASSE